MKAKIARAVRVWRRADPQETQPKDPLGSYTGVPREEGEKPDQDADDL